MVRGVASDGKSYCWGDDNNGAIGQDNGSGGNEPLATLVNFTNLVAGSSLLKIFSASEARFNLSIASDGKAYSWGIDDMGQLGDGTTGSNTVKPSLIDTTNLTAGSSFKSASMGANFSFGIASDGKTYSWGDDSYGKLGNGGANTATNVPNLIDTTNLTAGSSFIQIEAGDEHACGLASDGKVYCWGVGARGEIGDDAVLDDKNIPTPVTTTNLTAGTSFIKLGVGAYFNCGLTNDGKIYCWGADFSGAIGNDVAIAHQNIPVEVNTTNVPAGSRFTDIKTTAYGACALTDQRRVFCWGSDSQGQLGNGGANTDSPIPVEIDYSNL